MLRALLAGGVEPVSFPHHAALHGGSARRIRWCDLGRPIADSVDGTVVELSGFPVPPLASLQADHFVLAGEPGCCPGCAPRNPLAAVEVFAATALPMRAGALRLTGEWHVLRNDPAGWRYQLQAARAGWSGIGRRSAMVGGPLFCLAATNAAAGQSLAWSVIEAGPAIDLHSHAGGIALASRIKAGGPFSRVAEPMRDGGMAVTCLAMVSDSSTHRVMADGRIHPYRDPAPGELYAYSQLAFGRVLAMVREQGLTLIADVQGLRAARAGQPSVIIAAEGADFLEGQPERVNEAHARWTLRQLQLTHYRVNELGDIQTEAPVHNGLTDVGAEVIRRCNRLGIVVDVAHGTYDLVRRAASVTTKPLVLSHTSLASLPPHFSRRITPRHAKVIAETGGVIGVWPPAHEFPTLSALAVGMARMVDAAGIDHVGLGSDMRGLVGPSIFPDYGSLPGLVDALLGVGFSAQEAGKLLGGNYARVFEASMA
jgi:membrane dipeptidase